MKIHPLIVVLAFCLLVVSVAVVDRIVDGVLGHIVSSAATHSPDEEPPRPHGPVIFHEPQTEPEKLLNKLIGLDESDANFYSFIHGTPGYDPAQDTGYARFLSQALVKTWRDKEASLVKENCGGKYIDGDICGLDYMLIVCGQDWPDTYIFRTIKPTRDSAIVITSWQPHSDLLNAYPAYRFIRVEGRWRLDGVACGKDLQFHMPPGY